MKVNFDRLREKGVCAYNRLTVELNGRIHGDSIISDSREHGDPLTVGDILNEMREIHDVMATLICLQDKENGIECLNMKLVEFAPEEAANERTTPPTQNAGEA